MPAAVLYSVRSALSLLILVRRTWRLQELCSRFLNAPLARHMLRRVSDLNDHSAQLVNAANVLAWWVRVALLRSLVCHWLVNIATVWAGFCSGVAHAAGAPGVPQW
jgi:hypothetical protein